LLGRGLAKHDQMLFDRKLADSSLLAQARLWWRYWQMQ
jgi:hypothetical protein